MMKKILLKYVKKNTMIYPSDINFLNETELKLDEKLLIDLNSKIDFIDKKSFPKLQVTQKNGFWFALNNTMLFMFQNLQQQNKCDKIHVEVVPLNKVPIYLQNEMIAHFETSDNSSSDSCCSNNLNNTVSTIISQKNNLNKISSNQIFFSNSLDSDENQKDESLVINKSTSLNSSSTNMSGFIQIKSDYYVLTCNYCEKKFKSLKLLKKHKLRKKHFACTNCGEHFDNSMKLENHKHSIDHWSDEDT